MLRELVLAAGKSFLRYQQQTDLQLRQTTLSSNKLTTLGATRGLFLPNPVFQPHVAPQAGSQARIVQDNRIRLVDTSPAVARNINIAFHK